MILFAGYKSFRFYWLIKYYRFLNENQIGHFQIASTSIPLTSSYGSISALISSMPGIALASLVSLQVLDYRVPIL